VSRYAPTKSHVLYHPTALGLNLESHRASLEGANVSLLSGRDPHAPGCIRRIPGGKCINYAGNHPDDINSIMHNSRVTHRTGSYSGFLARTKTTAIFAIPGAANTAVNVDVLSTVEFAVNQWVAVYEPNANPSTCFVGYIAAINSDTQFSLKSSNAAIFNPGGAAANMPSGAIVVQCMPIDTAIGNGTTSVTTSSWPAGIDFGDSVHLLGYKSTGIDSRSSYRITKVEKTAGPVWTIYWTGASPLQAGVRPCAIVPIESAYTNSEVWSSQLNGDIHRVYNGALGETIDASADGFDTSHPWRFGRYGWNVIATNGIDRPLRFGEGSTYNRATGQLPPRGFVGISEDSDSVVTAWARNAAAGGVIDAGDHRIFLRLVDKRTYPHVKSPPLAEAVLTAVAGDTFRFVPRDIRKLGDDYVRCTHYEVWMTPVDLQDYYLVETDYLSAICDVDGTFLAAWDIDISDDDLVLMDYLDPNDRKKQLMPAGRYTHFGQGVLFTAGSELSRESDIWKHSRVTQGNVVYFSRVDAEEPENFPAGNFKALGAGGEEIMGFEECDYGTMILMRDSFAVVRRAASFLVFEEDGAKGFGLGYDDAYTSMGSHIVWVGPENVWLYDPGSMDAPFDIGEPIRPWLQDLKYSASQQVGGLVRVGCDTVRRMLWVSISNDDYVVDAMIYSWPPGRLFEGGWIQREHISVCAPFSMSGIEIFTESKYHLYGWSKGRFFRLVDYDEEPLIHGGLTVANPASDTDVLGTVTAGQAGVVAQLAGLTDLPLADYLCGLPIRFFSADGTEKGVRIIDSNDGGAGKIEWGSNIVLEEDDTWIVGGIPFRLRFPPIRGQDPFSRKVAFGVQTILDGVEYPNGLTTGDATLVAKVLENFSDTAPTGGAGALALKQGAATQDEDFTADMRGSGRVLEIQLEQLNRHCHFKLLWLGVPVQQEGTFVDDSSAAV